MLKIMDMATKTCITTAIKPFVGPFLIGHWEESFTKDAMSHGGGYLDKTTIVVLFRREVFDWNIDIIFGS